MIKLALKIGQMTVNHDMHSKWYKRSLKRWIITAAHCCTNQENTKMIMADSVVAYFGEHSEFGYGKTGTALKSERD